jgi:hypothetical protein
LTRLVNFGHRMSAISLIAWNFCEQFGSWDAIRKQNYA